MEKFLSILKFLSNFHGFANRMPTTIVSCSEFLRHCEMNLFCPAAFSASLVSIATGMEV